MVLLEAMVADLPSASAACGGALEVVGETGLRFEFGRVDELAHCLRMLYGQSEAQRNAQCRRQRQRLEALFTDAAAARAFWQLPVIQSLGLTPRPGGPAVAEIGRASCRERVWWYGGAGRVQTNDAW